MNDLLKVVDASLAIKWLAEEDDSDKAYALYLEWDASGVQIAAPHLMLAETVNALHRKVVDGKLAPQSMSGILENMDALGVRFYNLPNMHGRAWQLAEQLNQGAVYDSIYLALAERLDCELWTADRRFYRVARRFSNRIRRLGDFVVAP